MQRTSGNESESLAPVDVHCLGCSAAGVYLHIKIYQRNVAINRGMMQPSTMIWEQTATPVPDPLKPIASEVHAKSDDNTHEMQLKS
jgi:hypothetical protein